MDNMTHVSQVQNDKVIGGASGDAHNILYTPAESGRSKTNVNAELDRHNNSLRELNTHLLQKVGVGVIASTVPSTDNTNAYFNYPSGYTTNTMSILSVEAFNGTKLTVNPSWAQVDLYAGNGAVLCSTIPSDYKGQALYIQYATK